MRCLLLCLSIFMFFQSIQCQPPIPTHPPGYVFMGSRSNPVVLEVFYDNLCINSALNWPNLYAAFGNFSEEELAVIIHIFPLPYHRNSFYAAWVGQMILHYKPTLFPLYMSELFNSYDDFITGSKDNNDEEVMEQFAGFVEKVTGISSDFIESGFSNSKYNYEARVAWKYACSRGVSGTPTFIINGITVPNASDYSTTNWIYLISKLLGSN